MTDFSKKHVAQVIQRARKNANLKQSRLAELVGISEKHLSKIETGKNYPALDNFLKIANILNLSLEDFGIEHIDNNSENKIELKKIINVSSDEQINIYLDLINVVQKYI